MPTRCSISIWVILFLFYCENSFAQVEKGRLSIGGGFSISAFSGNTEDNYIDYSNQSEQNSFSGSLSPSLGLFLNDGLVVGLTPGFTYSSYDFKQVYNDGGYETETNSFSSWVRTYITYYIGSSSKGRPFVTGAINRGWNTTHQTHKTSHDNTVDIYKYEYDLKSAGFFLSGGYGIFLNDSFILSMYAGVDLDVSKGIGSEAESWSFNKQFSIGASISSTLKRKSK